MYQLAVRREHFPLMCKVQDKIRKIEGNNKRNTDNPIVNDKHDS